MLFLRDDPIDDTNVLEAMALTSKVAGFQDEALTEIGKQEKEEKLKSQRPKSEAELKSMQLSED